MNTKVKCFVGALLCAVILVVSAQAFTGANCLPAIFNLKVSGSVSERDFQKINQIVAQFAEQLHTQSLRHPWDCADWLTISWGYQHEEVQFINCSYDITSFCDTLRNQTPPKDTRTAVYNTIAQATREVIEMDDMLPGCYQKVIILIINDEENVLDDEAKKSIKQLHDDDEISLFVISIGNGLKVSEFEGVADLVVKINKIDDLLKALMLSIEPFPGGGCSKHYCSINEQN